MACARLKELFGASWVNVQPHSGAQANAAVMLAILQPGDRILGFNLAHGGHLTHGASVNFSGKLYKSSFYGVEKETGQIHWEKLFDLIIKEKPKLIICGASAYSRDWNYQILRVAADKVNAILLADIAHPAGLIAKNLLNNPLKYCHVITSTTHKTLRGPRGGIILMGEDFENPWGITTPKGKKGMMSVLLDSAVFPGIQGGPLEHVIAAKSVSFKEALSKEFDIYIQKVKKNARLMAQIFMDKGYQVISKGTDNHLMLIDLRSKKITGKEAEDLLIKADITVNKNMIPFDDESPFVTSGIRVGTAAITTRGQGESDMHTIVNYIDEVLINKNNERKIRAIKKSINRWMNNFPLFSS